MMGTTRVIQVGEDGALPDIQVVGFHGQVGADQTPARRGSVLADAEGRLVRILEVRPAGAGRREVLLEIDAEPLPAGELPGVGTRLAPLPARLGDYVVVVGERERARRAELARRAGADEPQRVGPVVRWLGGNEARSEELGCERLGDTVAWYCTPDEAFALWRRIQAVAEEAFYRALEQDKHTLIAASYWLSRAKVTDQDIYLAAAGLRRAGSPHWQTMLRAGARERSAEDWEAGLRRAEELFEHPPRFGSDPLRPIASTTPRERMRLRSLVRADRAA